LLFWQTHISQNAKKRDDESKKIDRSLIIGGPTGGPKFFMIHGWLSL
jgi:hypothetical protein